MPSNFFVCKHISEDGKRCGSPNFVKVVSLEVERPGVILEGTDFQCIKCHTLYAFNEEEYYEVEG